MFVCHIDVGKYAYVRTAICAPGIKSKKYRKVLPPID